jgi:hypothetical protein
MHVVYSNMPCEIKSAHSIFLIGPTPRSPRVESWRPEAIGFLERAGYRGTILVPEPFIDYKQQIEWEYAGTEAATVLAAWVPRKMEDMPGLTTNVEFGLYVRSGKLIYGRPAWAEKCRYLDTVYAREVGKTPHDTLESLLAEAMRWRRS